MDEEIAPLLASVRADTVQFARDVEAMRAAMDGPLQAGADRAGQAIEATLLRAVRTGKLGFEDLKRVALAALSEIAAEAVRAGVQSIASSFTRSSAGGSGYAGAPGRATGGPVSPARAYWVGERGPELFVPTASGRVETAATGPRDVRVAITVKAAGSEAPAALAQSSRQVARAVRAALMEAD